MIRRSIPYLAAVAIGIAAAVAFGRGLPPAGLFAIAFGTLAIVIILLLLLWIWWV